MIAIVVDEYEQAVGYVNLAGPLDPAYVVVRGVEDVPDVLTGAAFLGGSGAVRECVAKALERAPRTDAPAPRGVAGAPSA